MEAGIDEGHCVAVTHFINPHLFWYRPIDDPGSENVLALSVLEKELQDLYRNKPKIETRPLPAEGDKVAVNYVPWNKYIRASVLQIAEFKQDEYIVWAIDYGFPLMTKKEYLRPLPKELHTDTGLVLRGGLSNILPAELNYDHTVCDVVLQQQEQWMEKACDMLDKLLSDAMTITFVEKFKSSDNHCWGDLIILNPKGHTIHAQTYLQSAKCAIAANSDFAKLCCSLKTVQIAPWLTNNRKTKMQFNAINNHLAEHAERRKIMIMDDLAKRKVEDWCERNERQQFFPLCDPFVDSIAEQTRDQTDDDITFDDSISVTCAKQADICVKPNVLPNVDEKMLAKSFDISEKKGNQVNYLCKGGALTKLKQTKYGSKCNNAPNVDLDAFDMNNGMPMAKNDLTMKTTNPTPSNLSASSDSGSTTSSKHMQKLSELRASHARLSPQSSLPQETQNGLPDVNSETSKSPRNISSRMQKLIELRKLHARSGEKDTSKEAEQKNEHLAFDISLKSDATTSLIKETPQFLSPRQNKENLGGEAVQTPRAKKLSEIRRKAIKSAERIKSSDDPNSSTAGHNSKDNDNVVTTSESADNQVKTPKSAENSKPIGNIRYSASITANGEGKEIINGNTPEDDIDNFEQNSNFKLQPKVPDSVANTSRKEDSEEAAYEGLKLVPAGFDITRLNAYRDEENHWHRKKTTRHDKDVNNCKKSLTRGDVALANEAYADSSSSTDFFPLKAPTPKQKHSPSTLAKRYTRPNQKENIGKSILNMSAPAMNNVAMPQDNRTSNMDMNKNLKNSLGTNEISACTTTTFKTTPLKARRKQNRTLSPTSQLLNIDEILKEHDFKKVFGTVNRCNQVRKTSTPVVATPSNSDEKSSSSTCSTSCMLQQTNGNIDLMSTSGDEKNLTESPKKTSPRIERLSEVESHPQQLPVVKGEVAMQTKFIDHMVLAHTSVELKGTENINEAEFLPEVHEEMRHMRVNKVYRVQVYSWTHLLRGHSLFIVNPPRSGKTWAYLPALCTLTYKSANALRPTYGPVSLVLVASAQHVDRVHNYCRRLLSGCKSSAPSCVAAYGIRNFVDTKVQLLSGCGLLVITPSSLLRLLNDNESEPLIDWARLQHIVIDDLDLMLSRSHQDFSAAVRTLYKMCPKTPTKTLKPQLIVTSRDWDGVMIGMMRKSNAPLLLIGDHLEAAVYGRATLSVKLKAKEKKNETIHRFLKLQAETSCVQRRSLILCNSDEDVETVRKYLTECGHFCLCFYNRSDENELVLLHEWKSRDSLQILICTDDRFSELQILNAHTLVHYSLPSSWTKFTNRFSALTQAYENYVSNNFANALIASNARNLLERAPQSIILLDEHNSMQLPRLVEFMRRHNQAVHPDIQAVSKRVLILREEIRLSKGALLCPMLMEFGECDDARCDKRHELTRSDLVGPKDDMPSEGELRIHVLKVLSPTHYYARLLLHKSSSSGEWHEVRRSSEALTFNMQMNMYYRNEENLSLHWPPKINDLCVYKHTEHFRRAVILEAPPLNEESTNVVQSKLQVTLRLIDDGNIVTGVKCSELFVCPPQFHDFPGQAIEIRLMDVVPFDNERTWDARTTKQVHKWIVEDINAQHIIHAKISFCLANTIWVKNLVVLEELPTLGTYRQFVNLKMTLIKKNYGMIYEGARKHVRDIAEEYSQLKAKNNSTDIIKESLSSEDSQLCGGDESIDLIKFSSGADGDTSVDSESIALDKAKQQSEIKKGTNPAIDAEHTNSTKDSLVIQNNYESKTEKATEPANLTSDLKSMKEAKDSPSTSKILTKPPPDSNSLEENWDHISDDPQPNEVFVPLPKTKLPQTEPKQIEQQEGKAESWTQLKLNELTKVEIGDEGENGNWENIFLQVIDRKHMTKFDDLTALINKHVETLRANEEQVQRIYDFEPMQNCIVKYNNIYLRAKVHGVFGNKAKDCFYRFFLCDYACFANCRSSEMYNDFYYDTTDEIVNFIPYQAVHCTLAGIHWDRFTKRYPVSKDFLYACAVEERTEEGNMVLNLPIRSYKILLYECEKDHDFAAATMFNKVLVDMFITTTDEETKCYLDYQLDLDVEDEEKSTQEASSSGNDEVISYEQLLEFLKRAQELDEMENTLLCEAGKELKDAALEQVLAEKSSAKETEIEAKDLKCTKDLNNEKCFNSNKSSVSCAPAAKQFVEPPPPLKALHKRPLTKWYETDCLLYLSIHCPDCTDYSLEITQKTLMFAAKVEDSEYVLHLKLLGSVDPSTVSHEIKGLNIMVRAVKKVFTKWPRLLEEATKYAWLQYDYNSFDIGELEHIAPAQRLNEILQCASNLEHTKPAEDDLDSEDSETDKFETYNYIENNDQCYDG